MKRRLFQIHLSTALVLMVVSSGLVWVNVQGENVFIDEFTNEPKTVYGWPSVAVERYSAFYMIKDHDSYFPMWSGVLIDAVVAGLILATCGAACEGVLRKRNRVA